MKHLLLSLLFISAVNPTEGQIELVKDINPSGNGIGGSELVLFNDVLYFSGRTDNSNRELWRSDGTEAGTFQVIDIRGSGGSSPQDLTIAGDYLYFTALADDTNRELYRTDGTAEGTMLVADLRPGLADPGIDNLVAVGDKLFFTGNDGITGTELYVVEGTGAPVRLSDFRAGSSNSIFIDLVAFQDKLFFSTESDADGAGFELYISDGTPGGTVLFKDLYPGESDGNPRNFSVIGDTLFFSASDEAGYEPWISDGTTNGTSRIKDIYPGAEDSNPYGFTGNSADKVFFSANDENAGGELFITDGTADGTGLVKDILAESNFGSSPNYFTAADGSLFFVATQTIPGRELWYSDGTTEGTYMVEDLNEGANGADIQKDGIFWHDSVLYFGGEDGTVGLELRTTTIPVTGIKLVQDLAVGAFDASPADFVVMNDTLYFFAFEPFTGRELRKMALTQGEDLCDGISCPLGYACNEGECYLFVSGIITDDSTGLALEGVSVLEIRGQDTIQVTQTNESGRYEILLDSINNGRLQFSLDPYISQSRSLATIGAGSSLNISLSTDPCHGIFCGLGEVCSGGGCYEQISTYSGIVRDHTGNNVSGALVQDLYSNLTTYTDTDGRFLIDDSWQSIVILKEGYSPRYSDNPRQNDFKIILNYDPCFDSACGIGQVCKGGVCYSLDDTVYASFRLFDQFGFEIDDGIEVTELGTNNTYVTNGITKIQLVTRRPHLVLHDPADNYHDAVVPFISGQEVYYMEKDQQCATVSCPLGQSCYLGDCVPSNETIYIGYLMGYDSLALPFASVMGPYSQPTLTDINGFFEIEIPFTTDSILLRFDKTGYGSIELFCSKDKLNMVYMVPQNDCYATDCPDGYICYYGQCLLPENIPGEEDPNACAGVWCPLGEMCYDGQCYDPCLLDPILCYGPAGTSCDGVWCPLGEMCYGGGCYDPCLLNEDPSSNVCYTDPCDGISVPPGYTCSNGTRIPTCPDNPLACLESDPCDVINCLPGEDCFQCFDTTGYNTSGTSILSGTLNLGNLKSTSTISVNFEGVFLYLMDAETSRKVAIARTDDEGSFRFDSIPAADYNLFVVLPGYLITSEEQLISVGDAKNLQVDISSEDVFLQVSVTELSSASQRKSETYAQWYPTPNRDGRFYLDEAGKLEQVVLYNATGARVAADATTDYGNGQAVLTIDPFSAKGVYFLRWKVEGDPVVRVQTLLLQ